MYMAVSTAFRLNFTGAWGHFLLLLPLLCKTCFINPADSPTFLCHDLDNPQELSRAGRDTFAFRSNEHKSDMQLNGNTCSSFQSSSDPNVGQKQVPIAVPSPCLFAEVCASSGPKNFCLHQKEKKKILFLFLNSWITKLVWVNCFSLR